MLKIFPINNFPIIKKDDNLAELILQGIENNATEIKDFDIIIIAQTIISRAEGQIINLDEVEPSEFAVEIANQGKKDPKYVEMILREAKNICKNRNGVLITETKHGFVCANSGIDRSNVPGENTISLLPENPDKSAKEIRMYIQNRCKKKIAVLISDTHNRPFRLGAINIAIGCSGIDPVKNYINKTDLFGYKLKSSSISLADQLCSAAGLVMGESDEGNAVIVIRGLKFKQKEISAKALIRPEERDYFR
ncbi:MAG: coenzyme F420-0:L-glutamate ligase [Candidatus Heimdallarchaeota archaeon]